MTIMVTPAITEIAASLGLTEHELFRQALVSFLRDKKRQTLQLQLEILARYGADSLADLESKIAQGIVAEQSGLGGADRRREFEYPIGKTQ